MADTGIQPYSTSRVDYLAKYLQSLLPGLDYGVATKWINAERGVSGNVLGVTYNSGGSQHLFTYPSQEAGLRGAVALLHSNSAYSGFLNSLSSKNATTEARALAASPWNHSYYTNVFKSYIGGTASTGSGTGSAAPTTPNATTASSTTSGGGLLGIDLASPMYYIGIIMVGVVLILVGGIITLKGKVSMPIPIPV